MARWIYRASCHSAARRCLSGKYGLEIGGPSKIFETSIPIYREIGALDNCVFSKQTIWEGERESGLTFRYALGKRVGRNFIDEGSELNYIRDSTYDFILSSHNLEHMANPLKALSNWKRVLKPQGFLLLVLPDKARTFDYLRPVTQLKHLCDDYERNTPESDMTHLEEFVTLWDYSKYPIAKNVEEHRRRYERNELTRLMHHHVFDLDSAVRMVEYSGFNVLHAETLWPNNLIVLARKAPKEHSSLCEALQRSFE